MADLHDVEVRYGEAVVLAVTELRIEAGERVALIGSSGAGKTTLLDLLAGLKRPDQGRVEVFGADLDSLPRRKHRAHRRRIGMVSQATTISPSLRVVHNVNGGRLGSWSTIRSVRSLIKPVGVPDAAEALEAVGLHQRIFDRSDELSGGEQQRVAIARVLCQRPELALADEPTSSVDPRLSDDMMRQLCGPSAPWTTVVSAHDPDLARRYASRIIGLRHGRVAFDQSASAVTDQHVDDLYR